MQGEPDNIALTPAKDASQQEEAEKTAKLEAAQEKAAQEKAAKEKAAKKEAERLEAEKAKEAKLKAEKKKAAQKKAAEEKKAEQEAKENAKPKVSSNADKITRLEESLKRQIVRANETSERKLNKRLKQLENEDASEDQIATAKEEAAVALKEKVEAIETRINARIEKLKE